MNSETFRDDCLEERQTLSLYHSNFIIALETAADFGFELPVRLRCLKEKSCYRSKERGCRLATSNPTIGLEFRIDTFSRSDYTKVET